MITKDNISVYAELFAEANKCLQDISINDTIDSIEEYFKHLHDLVWTTKNSDGKYEKVDSIEKIGEDSVKFLRLPLDEPMFEINANTREIQVPRDNWTHGVRGDEIAEVLFFRINRYFDATDLAQMNIAIEWNNGSEVGSTESFIKYVEEDSKDKDLKIIFGWPLDGKITANASTVRFSIHFYQSGDNPGEYIYSFHTLPQEIHIKDTLKIDYDKVKIENFRNTILGRVSSSSGDKLSTASIPYFILPSELNTEIDDISSGYTMTAVAGRERGEATSYKWYQGKPGDTSASKELSQYEAASVYLPVDNFLKNTINGNTVAITTYFYDNGKDKEAIGCYDENDFIKTKQGIGTLYVLVSQYFLSNDQNAGQYWVEVKNRYGLTQKSSLDDKENNIPVWVITSPLKPVIQDLPEYYDIDSNNFIEPVVSQVQDNATYTWYYADNKNGSYSSKSDTKNFKPLDEGYYYLVITNSRNNSFETTESSKIIAVKNYDTNMFVDEKSSWVLLATFGSSEVKINQKYSIKDYEIVKCEWFQADTSNPADEDLIVVKEAETYTKDMQTDNDNVNFSCRVPTDHKNYLIARITLTKFSKTLVIKRVLNLTSQQEG